MDQNFVLFVSCENEMKVHVFLNETYLTSKDGDID